MIPDPRTSRSEWERKMEEKIARDERLSSKMARLPFIDRLIVLTLLGASGAVVVVAILMAGNEIGWW